jgi:hypothetical protein
MLSKYFDILTASPTFMAETTSSMDAAKESSVVTKNKTNMVRIKCKVSLLLNHLSQKCARNPIKGLFATVIHQLYSSCKDSSDLTLVINRIWNCWICSYKTRLFLPNQLIISNYNILASVRLPRSNGLLFLYLYENQQLLR